MYVQLLQNKSFLVNILRCVKYFIYFVQLLPNKSFLVNILRCVKYLIYFLPKRYNSQKGNYIYKGNLQWCRFRNTKLRHSSLPRILWHETRGRIRLCSALKVNWVFNGQMSTSTCELTRAVVSAKCKLPFVKDYNEWVITPHWCSQVLGDANVHDEGALDCENFIFHDHEC